MKKIEKLKKNPESGEVMIEGMIVMIITMFILVWILGLGFLYYQRYVTTIVTNDAAVKIASTYNNPTSDIIMGYVNTEDISNRDLYRNFPEGNLNNANTDRAESYVKYIMDQSNFAGTVKNVDVELELVRDSLVRKHVELNVECEFKTPFGEIFEMFGMDETAKYSVTACADYTDMAEYITTVNYIKSTTDGTFTADAGALDSIVGSINKFVEIYNHIFSS